MIKFTKTSDYIRPFLKFAKEYFNRSLIGAEIGIYCGDNALDILKNLDITCLHLVDLWPTRENLNGYTEGATDLLYPFVVDRFKDYNNVVIHKKDSVDASKLIEDELDFCYIDANHLYEYVLRDFEAWYPKVKKFGVIGGHDLVGKSGVIKAVTEIELKYKLNIITNFDWPGEWWVVK